MNELTNYNRIHRWNEMRFAFWPGKKKNAHIYYIVNLFGCKKPKNLHATCLICWIPFQIALKVLKNLKTLNYNELIISFKLTELNAYWRLSLFILENQKMKEKVSPLTMTLPCSLTFVGIKFGISVKSSMKVLSSLILNTIQSPTDGIHPFVGTSLLSRIASPPKLLDQT